MVHLIEGFAPGIGEDAPDHIAAALADAGRTILSRTPLPEAPPPLAEGTLRWQLCQLREDGGTFLTVEEAGGSWDPAFFRALSARAQAVVVAREEYRRLGKAGLATFMFGRTVDFAAYETGDRVPEGLDALYETRFAALCGTLASRLRASPILLAEDWRVSPPLPFSIETPAPQSWLFLPNIEAADWRNICQDGLAEGWFSRQATIRGASFVELGRNGGYEEEMLAALSARAAIPVFALTLNGGGEPWRWAEASGGAVEARGSGSDAPALIDFLTRAANYAGEAPGMILGRNSIKLLAQNLGAKAVR